MKVIYGGRVTGKTTKLIKHASETGSMIVASTTAEKRCIQEKAKQMYEIKMIANPHICVVVPSELKNYANDAKVVVDNAEYVLQNLLGYQIDAITINMENKSRYVDADKVLKAFCDTCASKSDWFCESLCKIKEKIDSVPTRVIAWMEMGELPEPYKPVKKVYKPVYISEHDCCECDNYRGRILDETYCCIHGCVTGVCEDFVYGSEE